MTDEFAGLKYLMDITIALPIGAAVKYITDAIKGAAKLSGAIVLMLAMGLALTLSIAAIALQEIAPETFPKMACWVTAIKGIFTGIGAFIFAVKYNKWTDKKPTNDNSTENQTTIETGD